MLPWLFRSDSNYTNLRLCPFRWQQQSCEPSVRCFSTVRMSVFSYDGIGCRIWCVRKNNKIIVGIWVQPKKHYFYFFVEETADISRSSEFFFDQTKCTFLSRVQAWARLTESTRSKARGMNCPRSVFLCRLPFLSDESAMEALHLWDGWQVLLGSRFFPFFPSSTVVISHFSSLVMEWTDTSAKRGSNSSASPFPTQVRRSQPTFHLH